MRRVATSPLKLLKRRPSMAAATVTGSVLLVWAIAADSSTIACSLTRTPQSSLNRAWNSSISLRVSPPTESCENETLNTLPATAGPIAVGVPGASAW
jgi:hypothetical protein